MTLLVIGAGPAGMMAALTAADPRHRVILLEKNEKPGRKLMITGKGRCNVTNHSDVATLLANVPHNPRFLYSAFNAFDSAAVEDFFTRCGVALKTERGNRVFPASDKASDIVDALRRTLKERRVNVVQGTAHHLVIENGTLRGVITQDGRRFDCDACLIATGGASYPATGSTGDGYALAREAGHTVTPLRPSLAPLVIKEGCCAKMAGLTLKNVSLKLLEEGSQKPLFDELGEMLFTHTGVSGPLVLSASAHIRAPGEKAYQLVLDLKPALDRKKLDARLLRDFGEAPTKQFKNSLDRLLPLSMIPTVVTASGIDPAKPVNQITKEERAALIDVLKGMVLHIRDFGPLEEAIVTCGGVCVKEIDPATMASKRVKGLYFAGEVLDVDAYTGGFNLQIAFSTGHAAGVAMKGVLS